MFIYLHKYVLSNADWGPLKLFVYFTDQRNMGMSMKVERSSLDQVKARFAQNKKKLEEKKKDYDLDERLAEQREEVRTCKYEHFFIREILLKRLRYWDDGMNLIRKIYFDFFQWPNSA